MDEWCATTLDMSVHGIEAGILLLRSPDRGTRFLSCFMFMKAPPGKRLSLSFRKFQVYSPSDCGRNYLQLYDDRVFQVQLSGEISLSLRPGY